MPKKIIDGLSMDKAKRLTERGLHADGNGLYLRVSATGAKSWIYRYKSGDKLRDMGLGGFPETNLHDAREMAYQLGRQRRHEGVDPIDARRDAREAAQIEKASRRTFAECAEEFIKLQEARNQDMTQWRQSLRDYTGAIGDLSVGKINTPLVVSVLEPIWHTIPETASRVRQRIERVLDFAKARHYRDGDNPATVRLIEDAGLLPREQAGHHKALPYAELPAWFATLQAETGPVVRPLQFLILTACRLGEALGARWREVDLEAKVWTVPASRMKSRKDKWEVPLSDAALAVLGPPGKPDELVFPARRGGVLRQPALWERCRPYTVHGFRSTFADWAAEKTTFPFEVREMALAHKVGDAVVRSYLRTELFDRRRQLAEAWTRYATGEDAAEVVRLRPAG